MNCTKFLFGLIIIVKSISSHSQGVGINQIGNLPDGSAALDLNFPNKGLLIPRVSLTSEQDDMTIPLPATSLLVYNSGLGGLQPAGYYYNQGTPQSPKWVRLIPATGTGGAWLIEGNSSTNSHNHFLGTTDIQDLVLKTNNIERIRISGLNGNVGLGVSNPTQRLDIDGSIKFSGELRPADDPGLSGQVLTSQGVGNSPTWSSVIKGMLAGAWEVAPTNSGISTNITSWVDTDVSLNFTLSHTCTVYMFYSINVQPDVAPGDNYVQTRLSIDGIPDLTTASHFQPFCSGDCNVNLNGAKVLTMTPGNHTVTLQWKVAPYNPVTWSSNTTWCDYCAARKLVVLAFYE